MPDGVLSGDAPQVRAPLNLRILRKGIQTRVRASRVLDLAATLRVRKGAKGAKGSRAWAAFHRRPFCCWNDPDDWAVAGRAWAAIVTLEQMFQKLIDFTVLVAAQFDVFLEGQIARTSGFFRGMKSSNSFEPDTVKLFTRLICWHGRRNNTTTEM